MKAERPRRVREYTIPKINAKSSHLKNIPFFFFFFPVGSRALPFFSLTNIYIYIWAILLGNLDQVRGRAQITATNGSYRQLTPKIYTLVLPLCIRVSRRTDTSVRGATSRCVVSFFGRGCMEHSLGLVVLVVRWVNQALMMPS